MLVTEEEARKMFFTPEARPSPKQMARLRKQHQFPALQLGSRVLYWSEEFENHLRSLDPDKSKN